MFLQLRPIHNRIIDNRVPRTKANVPIRQTLIPVVIVSTHYDRRIADTLHQNGASYFIRKPTGFSQLRELISLAVELVTKKNILRPEKDDFLLEVT